MAPKLSWELQGTSLQLTVKDGPQTSTWTIRRNAPPGAVAALLSAVQASLVPQGQTAPQSASVANPGRTKASSNSGVNLISQEFDEPTEADAERELENEIHDVQTEKESLEELKRRAYAQAVKNRKWTEDPDEVLGPIANQLPQREVRDGKGDGGQALPSSGPAVDGSFPQARKRPNVNDPNFRYLDTH